jgi:hypothetical protein
MPVEDLSHLSTTEPPVISPTIAAFIASSAIRLYSSASACAYQA